MARKKKGEVPSRKAGKSSRIERERFIAAARELECDESPEAFEGTLLNLARTKPMSNAKVKEKARRSREQDKS